MANKCAEFIRLLREHGINPKTIYDLGAFDFAQSRELAEAFPEAWVYAFEPVWPSLNINFHPRVMPLMLAVGEVDGPVEFFRSIGENPECGSVLEPNGEWPSPMPTQKLKVAQVRLDAMIESEELEPPDAIWMDVQGNEPAALRGLGKYLQHAQMIWSEVAYRAYYHGQMLAEEFDRFMAGHGFERVYEHAAVPEWFGDRCYVNAARVQGGDAESAEK